MRISRLLSLCGVLLLLLSCATTQVVEKRDQTLDAANAHVELAFSYIQNGDMPAAYDQLQRSEQIASNNPHLDHAYAIYHQNLGEFNKAQNYFDSAVRKAPTNSRINNNYGVLLTSLEKYDDAYTKFEIAYNDRDYPFRYSAYENYGDTARLQGQNKKAVEAYQQALNINGNWFVLHVKLAQSYYNLAEFLLAYQSMESYMQSMESLNLSPSKEDLELGIAVASAIRDYETVDSYQELLQQIP